MTTVQLVILVQVCLTGLIGFLFGRQEGHPALGAVLGAVTGWLGVLVYALYANANRPRRTSNHA